MNVNLTKSVLFFKAEVMFRCETDVTLYGSKF